MNKIRPYLFNKNNDEEYLNKAIETANWIDTLSVNVNEGKYWSRSPKLKDDELVDFPYYSPKGLYSGSAGVGQFLVRLFEVTRNEKYLEEAKKAAEYIIATKAGIEEYEKYRNVKNPEGLAAYSGWGYGIYNGPAGEGLFLDSLLKYVEDDRYVSFIKDTADTLLEALRETEDGPKWSDEGDVSSDGGLILYLVTAYERIKDSKYIEEAKRVADRIGQLGQPAKNGGKYWAPIKIASEAVKGLGIETEDGSDYFFPNFAHGTTGLGYVFAALYKATKEERYLEYAKDIALYIEGIAIGDEEAALVPYLDSLGSGESVKKYYLSTCHGPAGSSILFMQLYEITKDEDYLEWVKRFARGTVAAGVPEKNSWGYWPSYSLCCGAPGVLEYFVKVYELTKEEEFLDYAVRTADVLVGDAFNIGDGLTRWVNAWTRADQGNVDTYIGLYMGASGCAISLLSLYAAKKGIKVNPVFEYLY